MHTYSNITKAMNIGNPFWEESYQSGLLDISADIADDGQWINTNNHPFINMCSFSYLGLDVHPDIVTSAANSVLKAGALNSAIARLRIHLSLLRDAEHALSNLFSAEAITAASCSAASAAILPLVASGVFTNNAPPVMIFDKMVHLSLSLIKPICADETTVLTSPHNDLNFIEDVCKQNKTVAYVADGVYSTGGCAPVKELLELQNKYGLFLIFDEAHSISAYGKKGRGYVLDIMGEINDRTIIVASLNKGFGASGGVILFKENKYMPILNRFGGPLAWSQQINTAGLGAIIASSKIHQTDELTILQNKLQENINYFDSLLPTENMGDGIALRLIPIKDESKAVEYSKKIYDGGFYTSPLFFPVISRGKAGLRIMIRADIQRADIKRFCDLITQIVE